MELVRRDTDDRQARDDLGVLLTVREIGGPVGA
jgi:hypothetical protein